MAFDGSGSFDDLDASENLTYAGTSATRSATAAARPPTSYTSIGTYTAELTVTDSGDKTGTDTIEIKVVPSKENRCKGLKGTIVGTPKADKLQGTKKRDVIIGLAGKDKLDGGRGRDVICGKGGDDKRLSGGEKNDKVFGGGGKDRAGGGPGRDLVNGGAGKDRLSGGGGIDGVVGGPGRDKCGGGETRDRTRSCDERLAGPASTSGRGTLARDAHQRRTHPGHRAPRLTRRPCARSSRRWRRSSALAGSEGEREAAEWIADRLRSAGARGAGRGGGVPRRLRRPARRARRPPAPSRASRR